MKKNTKIFLVAALIFSQSNCLFAQKDGFPELLKSNTADATKLSRAYLSSLFTGAGVGLNSGWYNSAKAKNLGKFDVSIQASIALVPQNDRSFDVSALGLSPNTRLANPNDKFSPTAFGKDVSGPVLNIYNNQGNPLTSIRLPQGAGISFVPSPQIQATVGIIKNTDVSLRYSPKVGSDDLGKMEVLGFGIKHEITDLLFPGKTEKIIPIDIAIGLAYSRINYNRTFAKADQLNESNSTQDLKQRIEGKFSGYTADIIVSKKMAAFTPFASLSYNTSKTDFGILGDYIIQTGINQYETVKDPITIKQTDLAALRANIGFSLHLAFFRLYGAYGISKYQVFTGGIGFGIGK